MTLLITHVRIASENSPDLVSGDVLISDGKIQQIGQNLSAPEGARVIDARNRILAPGMFDAHVHFREPGFEAKETIASGTASTPVTRSAIVSGLSDNTLYHYRLVASNNVGTTYGSDVTFTTTRLPPEVTTGESTVLSTTSVRVSG